MDSLTLEHLAPYLPYKLKLLYSDGSVRQLLYLDYRGIIPVFKPILRPIYDLCKEIEHEGIKFIPIVELFCTRYQREAFDILEIGDNYIKISWDKVRTSVEKFSYHHATQSFIYYEARSRKIKRIPFQHSMFKKMCSWHFDVEDLISRNLAIDINEIEGKEIKRNG